jgi:succinoglycan biosynthesis transport protein ExoP
VSVSSTTGTRSRRGRVTRVVVLAVVLGIVGALVGAFVGLRLAGVHTATANVLVSPLAGNPYNPVGNGTALVNLETEAQLVSSADVVAEVQRKVPGTDASALTSGLTVTVPANTQILTVAYASGQTDQSVRVAQAFAESYLSYRLRRATALVQTQVDQINGQISSLQKQQNKLGNRLDDVDDQNSGKASVLRAQVESTTSQLDQLKSNLADLQSTPLNPGQVITPATPPAPSAVPYWALGALGGLLAGVVLGVLLGSLTLARRTGPDTAGLGTDVAPAV